MALAMAISTLASSIVTPYISPYFLLLGGSEVLVGIFWAVSSFLNLLVVLPGGYVADVAGRKRILVLATFLTAFAYLLFSGSPSWPFLFIPQALIAIATLSNPALDAILADSMPEKDRSTGFGLVLAFSSLGWTFGPLVGGYLYDIEGVWGIRAAFLFSAMGVTIAGLVYHMFLGETFSGRQQTIARATESSSASPYLRGFLVEMESAFSQMSRSAKKFFLGYVCYEASVAVVAAYWSLLILYAMGFSGVEFGFIELAAGFSLVAFSVPMGRFSDRIGRPRAALLIAVCSAALLVWVVNCHLFIEVLLIGSLLDIFDPRPSVHGLRADLIPQHIRGRVISLLSVAGYAGSVLSVTAGGLLYARGPQLPFYVSAVLLVISGLCFASTRR